MKKHSSDKTRVTLFFTNSQFEDLKRFAQDYGVTYSSLVRQAVTEFVRKLKRKEQNQG